jgi:hypothetical protein
MKLASARLCMFGDLAVATAAIGASGLGSLLIVGILEALVLYRYQSKYRERPWESAKRRVGAPTCFKTVSVKPAHLLTGESSGPQLPVSQGGGKSGRTIGEKDDTRVDADLSESKIDRVH